MSILTKMQYVINRMDEEEQTTINDYIASNSVKGVTDVEVRTGVDRLLYNHAVNKSQLVKICGTTVPTFNPKEQQLIDEGILGEPFLQGQAKMYNRFDLQSAMDYHGVPKYRDYYNPMAILIENHKGGVCKTTTVRTLATACALDTELNAKVAMIDLDPQGSLGFQSQPKQDGEPGLTIAQIALRNQSENSPFNAFIEEYEVSEEQLILDSAFKTHLPNLDIFAAFPIDEEFTDKFHECHDDQDQRQFLLTQLRDFIIPVLKEHYDVIFIDTPPQDSPITWSALIAADMLFTPVAPKEMDYLSTKNFIRFTHDRIEQLGAAESLLEWKVMPVNYDSNSNEQKRIMDRLRRACSDNMTLSQIEHSELFIVADGLRRSIYDIQKTECRDNKYCSAKMFDRARNSADKAYEEVRSMIINKATK